MKNTLSNILKVKTIVAKMADTSESFEELEYEAKHDKEIMSLVTTKYLNVIIQKYATTLA